MKAQITNHRARRVSTAGLMTPREIKAKRILLGLTIKGLAAEAGRVFKRPVSPSTMAQILCRRMHGALPQVHELQKFTAKKLGIAVSDLKPPFESGR